MFGTQTYPLTGGLKKSDCLLTLPSLKILRALGHGILYN